jgi:hypothetical protein
LAFDCYEIANVAVWKMLTRCASIAAMIASSGRYGFWFYGYPKPQAEDGSRSV